VPLRYDLKPGDHLVYRQRFERQVVSEEAEQRTVCEWTTHLLATEPCPGGVVVGFQRNRSSAQLTHSSEKGRDTTGADQAGFSAQLQARRPAFAEANWIDAKGRGLLPWSAVREWRSLLLVGLHEVEPLPDQPVAPGSAWQGVTPLQFRMKASACPGPEDADCVLLEGAGDTGRLRAWFSRSRGLFTRIVVNAEYSTPPAARSREELTFDLIERRRGESIDAWLAAPDLDRKSVV
jgi:hypothetical protein